LLLLILQSIPQVEKPFQIDSCNRKCRAQKTNEAKMTTINCITLVRVSSDGRVTVASSNNIICKSIGG